MTGTPQAATGYVCASCDTPYPEGDVFCARCGGSSRWLAPNASGDLLQRARIIPHPPPRFGFSRNDAGDLVIRYRVRMSWFATLCFAFWTATSLAIALQVISGRFALAPFGLLIWLPNLLVAQFAAWFTVLRVEYAFARDRLTVTERCLWYRRSRTIRADHVRRVVQVKDGGEGEDTFPSWGIEIELTSPVETGPARLPLLIRLAERFDEPTNIAILAKQPIRASGWLGPIVATWAGVPFERVGSD